MAEGVNLKDGNNQPETGGVQQRPVSYADRLKTNIRHDQRLKRNVLEIEIEKLDSETEIILDQACVLRLLTSIGMNPQTQLKGYQIMYGRTVTLSV